MRKLPMFSVEQTDVLEAGVDMLILKFAQDTYGAARDVALRLGIEETLQVPDHRVQMVYTNGEIFAHTVVFIGTKPLHAFRYAEIREFGERVVKFIVSYANTGDFMRRRVGITMHGVGYGLDEFEAFSALMAGIFGCLADDTTMFGDGSSGPEIVILEKDPERANRLRIYLRMLVREFRAKHEPQETPTPPVESSFLDAGAKSEKKDHVFVAMPYSPEMDDVYEFGIRQAVSEAGLLCERCDRDIFTGDILNRIRDRIATAQLVIADLSGANANVYLEVGYAWGRNVPTLLVAREDEPLRFDVKTQKCLFYKNINDLRKKVQLSVHQLLKGRA